MSYEGHIEYLCECDKIYAEVDVLQPTECWCGKAFVKKREVDQTNAKPEYGQWEWIKPPVESDTPWGKLPPCRAHAFQHPEEDTFMVAPDTTVEPMREGMVRKGGLNDGDSQVVKRPPPPAAMTRRADTPANDNRYSKLRAVLDAAYRHAAREKGEERHANGRAFEDQPMMKITRDVGLGFPLGQAMKKAQEAGGMADRGDLLAAEKECLGAINYLAGAVIRLREMAEQRRVA
jgi:hypothetical protein